MSRLIKFSQDETRNFFYNQFITTKVKELLIHEDDLCMFLKTIDEQIKIKTNTMVDTDKKDVIELYSDGIYISKMFVNSSGDIIDPYGRISWHNSDCNNCSKEEMEEFFYELFKEEYCCRENENYIADLKKWCWWTK